MKMLFPSKPLSPFLSVFLLILLSFSEARATSVALLTGPGGNDSSLRVDSLNNFSTRFNTGVDFDAAMQGIPDIFANARFFMGGVHGSSNPGQTGSVNQSTTGGTFSLYSPQNTLLLAGIIGDGSIFVRDGGIRFLTQQLSITAGLYANYFPGPASSHGLQLDFAGLPTAIYNNSVTNQSVFTGRYENRLTGYNTVQTGTTQQITGYRDVLKCLDYTSVGRGCVPVDSAGHILAEYIGKWLFLSSTPPGIPVYDHIPIYSTVPTYAQVPVYTQVPIYENRQVITPVFAGWNWNSTFVSGVILGREAVCPPNAPVPEPGTIALLLSGVGMLCQRRRKSRT